ncbi:DUF3108 domain-containing protein [Humitalea sp. 24SJ18S-53]|uniref:DUF3108 domain-containing protein n=1 Tax=Humitalea sp. 24SJ18S-53 TaxID=3422307 RepID=UPI003D66BB8E
MQSHRASLSALALLPLLAAPAAAEPFRATYNVVAAGMTVMEIETVFDLAAPAGYRIHMSTRLRGLAGFLISGQQVTAVRGAWAGTQARPARYETDGVWRGETRRILLEYPAGEPEVRTLIPPNDAEREPVPPDMARGTMDSLSALAQLSRAVGATQSCDATAGVYDGRRRTDFVARTNGWERLPAGRESWAGDAIRCEFQGRQVAGFLLDQDRAAEWRRPQEGTAWLASVRPGTPPVPVRLEIPTRMFGRITAYLVSVAPEPRNTEVTTPSRSAGLAATGASPAIAARP